MAALELYPYQKKGVKFLLQRPVEMRRKPHRLLADAPGLGKTAQAIVATKKLNAKSILIVCPASVKYNWRRQMVLWGLCDTQDVFIINHKIDTIPHYRKIVVVNYDLVIDTNIYNQLADRNFHVAIFDEAHRLKTMSAQRSRMVLGRAGIVRNCFWKFMLTGTPVPNRPIEFFIILKTMCPELIEPYTKWVDFGKYFCKGFESDYGEKDPETGRKWNFKGASNVKELAQRIKPFMLRRELQQVFSEMPDMVENTVYLDVDINQHPEVVEQMEDESVARTEDFDAETEMPQATIRRIVGECKVEKAAGFIIDKLEGTDKVLVFAYHQNVIANLKQKLRKFKPVVIKGGLSAKKKDDAVQKFIGDDSHRIILVQINAGGEGIDGLQKVCSTVIFAEIDWSDGGMRQAKARLHRLGQKEVVFIYFLIADNTMELIMAATLERKSSVINQLINIGDTNVSIESLLESIDASLKTLVAQGEGGGSDETPAKKAPAKKAPAKKSAAKPKGPSNEDLKDAAKAFVDAAPDNKKKAKAILKKLGADKLAELEEEKWAEAIELFNEGTKASEAESDDEDEDDDI